MQQQINLYLPEFRPNREPLRAVHMGWGLLGVFIVLMLISVLTEYQYHQLTKEYAQVDQIQKGLQTQLQTVAMAKPALSGPELDVTIEKLQKDLSRRQHIVSVISSQHLGNQRGFSAQMLALANQSLDTISLESFSLQKGGNYAELSGRARSADQVPLYVQKLRADPSFAQVGFGVLNVGQDENSSGVLQFSLAKAVEEKAEKSKSPIKDIYNVLFD